MFDPERESMELEDRARRLREIADALYRQAADFDEQARDLVAKAGLPLANPEMGI